MKRLILPAAMLLVLASCSKKEDVWTLNGEIPADAETVTIEMPFAAGGWYTADTIRPDSSGRFTLTSDKANRSIYRLNIDGRYIYLPADSTETLTLVVQPDYSHAINGSDEAILFSEVDRILQSPDSTMRRRLLVTLQDHLSSTAAYYANLRLNWSDKTLLRAVANAYVNNLPDDSRTAILRNRLSKLVSGGATPTQGEQIVIEAPEIGYFDIDLIDREGNNVKLSSTVEKSKISLLAFVDFSDKSAPAVNITIGEALSRYPSLGVYEVGFDANQHQWAASCAELPWTNVFQSESASTTHIGQYAVAQLPTMFIIVDGEIRQRIEDPSELLESIKKFF